MERFIKVYFLGVLLKSMFWSDLNKKELDKSDILCDNGPVFELVVLKPGVMDTGQST